MDSEKLDDLIIEAGGINPEMNKYMEFLRTEYSKGKIVTVNMALSSDHFKNLQTFSKEALITYILLNNKELYLQLQKICQLAINIG